MYCNFIARKQHLIQRYMLITVEKISKLTKSLMRFKIVGQNKAFLTKPMCIFDVISDTQLCHFHHIEIYSNDIYWWHYQIINKIVPWVYNIHKHTWKNKQILNLFVVSKCVSIDILVHGKKYDNPEVRNFEGTFHFLAFQ